MLIRIARYRYYNKNKNKYTKAYTDVKGLKISKRFAENQLDLVIRLQYLSVISNFKFHLEQKKIKKKI